MSGTQASAARAVAAKEPVRPLAGLAVLEECDPDSNEVSRAAVAFAGLLCSRFGAHILRPDHENDPMKRWPPLLSDGSSAAFRFLNEGKTRLPAGWEPAADMLLSNDPDRIKGWKGRSSVLVRPAHDDAAGWSELTIQAASGLLDIFGESGLPPLPLPGRLAAYAAGMAAFDALVANYLAWRSGRCVGPAEVSVLDTALWVNWKHLLAAGQGRIDAGIGRSEDWRTLPCRDGYIALTFQDKDVGKIAAMIEDPRLLAPEFNDRISRGRNPESFLRIISEWTRRHSRSEIVRRARDFGIPIGPVLGLSELADDDQFRYRSFIRRAAGGYHVANLPLLWDGLRPAGVERCHEGSE